MSKKRSAASLAATAPEEGAAATVGASAEKKAKLTRGASGGSAATPASPRTAASANNLPSGVTNGTVALTPAAYSARALANSVRFKAYSSGTADRAHTILHEVLPRKVLELDYLCSTTQQSGYQCSVSAPYHPDGTFIAGRETEPIASNPSVMALIPKVKTEVLQMIDHLGALKLMIQLRIPAVDDGNNFGVEIQEESINELAKVEDAAFSYMEKIQSYYGNRTRVAAKISKYPAILDYWQSLSEIDESFYTDLRLHMIEMRNSYVVIHDLLLKNEERIKNPRGEAGDADGKSRRHAFA